MRKPARPNPGPEVPHVLPLQPGFPVRMRRFVVVFAICLLLGFGLVLAPFAQPVVTSFTEGLVEVSGRLIRFFGGRAVVTGNLLQSPANHFGIQMVNGCNALNVTLLLWAAVLAFPASWSQKAKGLLAGTAAIHAVNVVRFVSLFYIGQYNQAWFDFAHWYLWESVMMLDTLVVFWIWVHMVRRSGSMRDASPQ